MVREVPDYARQYQIEHPEFGPLSNPGARAPSPAKPNQARVAQAPVPARPQKPQPAQQNASQKSVTTDPATERRKNAAHGASRGTEPENNPAPQERKNPRDPSSDKVENSKEYKRIQQAEAAIPGAMAGN
jgi:hypothetical protein